MRPVRSVIVVFFVALVLFSMPVAAQNFPWPTKEGEPLATFDGKYLYPYGSPYARHVGRFVDSTFTSTYYSYPRTLRAKGMSVVPEHGRVYAMIGEHFVAYNLSTFFTQDLGKPLSSSIISAPTRKSTPEQYLPWAAHTYPEEKGSGWAYYVIDGLDRLYDYSWDDRGYTYAAYYVWGWGTLDSNLKLIKQVDWNETTESTRIIESFKVDNKYYVLVSGKKLTEIWDVTQPTAPRHLRTMEFGIRSSTTAQTGNGMVVAMVGNAPKALSETRLYRASDLVKGGAPIVTGRAGFQDVAVDTDGTNFYVLSNGTVSGTSVITTYSLINPSAPSYSNKSLDVSGYMSGIRYGSGHITAWGANDVWLYRLENGGLVERELGDYFANHYAAPSDPQYYETGSKTYTSIASAPFGDVLYASYGGKDYLIICAMGLGDVYELEATDRLSVSAQGVKGTRNPNTPSDSTGIFYGDPLGFTASYPSGALSVNWNFGNPEGIATENQQSTQTDSLVTYQYAGLTTPSAITAVKTVTVRDASNSANSADTTVSMKVPTARVRIQGTEAILPGADLATGVLAGQTFVDASDGTLQSHYGEWNIDDSITPAAAGYGVSVGTCGTHLLTYTARYVPYTGTGTNVTPRLGSTQHFTRTVGPVTYEVRPFEPKMELVSTGEGITFRNKTRYNASTFNTGTTWTVDWTLKNSVGTAVKNETDVSPLGTLDTFALTSAEYQSGYTVEMKVTFAAGAFADASCAVASLLTATTSYDLVKPDPVITIVSGCTVAQEPCEMKLTSASGADTSAWAVTWSLGNVTAGAGLTFKPTLSQEGTYQVTAAATNVFGAGEATKSLSVAAPACVAPGAFSMTWEGVTSGCYMTACTSPAESLRFSAAPWQWTIASCHKFSWDFGDGTKSTEPNPTKKYASNGEYIVTLKISNDTQTVTEITKVKLGTSTPPPPPPPTCSAPTAGSASPGFTGGTSGCSPFDPNCVENEVISFRGDAWQYVIKDCDSFRWTFGDGGTSTLRHPTHVYKSPGTYTVAFTIKNSSGSTTGETTLKVTSAAPVDPCPNTPLVTGIYFENSGGSGCTALNSTGCLPNESIKFKPETWQYNWQDCDQFLWEFGDGTTSTLKEPSHVFATGGDMVVKLTVTNTKGSMTVEKAILVGTPATKPTSANFTYTPGHPKPGEAITFTASTSGGDPATSWNWSFGDGGTGTGQTVTHTFVSEGKFSVGLEAKNSGGSAVLVKDVSVTDTMTYLLPVVTHAAGANDSSWRTDLHVFIPEFASPGFEVEVEFAKGTERSMEKTLTLDSSTRVIPDFLGEIKAGDDFGPVLLHSPVPLDIWSRTYVVSPSGVGTYGQLIPAELLDDSGQAVANETYWNIGGLRNTSRFRTNLGFVNPTGLTATVRVFVYDELGLPRGSFDVTVLPYQLRQDPMVRWYSDLPKDGGFSLRIQSLNGVNLISYASIIDNISNDPIYVGGLLDELAAEPTGKTLIVPGVGHSGSWRSDLTIFNPDSEGVTLNIEFFDDAGNKLGGVPEVPLPHNASLIVDDVLRSSLMNVEQDTIGKLKVTTTSPWTETFPIVLSRTYSDQGAEGTFGQGIPAIPAAVGNVSVGQPAVIPGVRNGEASGYKTNLGLVSLSSQETSLLIKLRDPINGVALWTRPHVLGPNRSEIIPNVMKNFLMSDLASGALEIEVLSGGPVWAYGSVIDVTTTDPEYVPAVPLPPSGSSAEAEAFE